MAMAQLASSTPSASASSGPASSSSSAAQKTEIQALLGQFDAQINAMMDYPAKDTINALTMLAERTQFAPEIVSFLETKIHRVAPNCKLPIFYLTDSILKNVRGPYLPLFAAKIVPLYCNCVSGKDLKRFIHVLNTWETTRLFSKEAIAQMRSAANRAMQQADPSARSAPASFNQEKSVQQARAASATSSSAKLAQQQQDMELRSLLTKLQNDMGIHPTEHMSLEEAQLDAHLDFLFQYNRARKERGKGGVSRSWYPDEDQWVADFSGDTAPRESTSSSFFDRTQKEKEKNAGEQASWENARVPVDETITRCRICGENFSKSWDEEEEDWMYTNAVAGTIHNTGPNGNEQQDTIFHKYCYDTVMANSKQVTPAHLIPAERDVAMKGASSDDSSTGRLKRSLEEVRNCG
ncbi:mRNA cleavage and polyadenylation factor I/II complex, subunit Pcf11 [Phytophthora cinnamomi]|uniref:mRNA cleavage and polyadenylation factor I/II complex, subunit Pcf11 n=1 Tax=Phytophthora cinnamomi TaxID=4785 RepID=UPI0035593BC1|nr:mRNA cleavage and polyadenylation factor I/II complex, subunit Pcf11 [Phytophthora cinnamomi]